MTKFTFCNCLITANYIKYYVIATTLLESMNKSVDPCDDFYQFSCGRFGNMHRIPKTSILTDQFSQVYNAMQTLIRGIHFFNI